VEKGMSNCVAPKVIIEAYGRISEQNLALAEQKYDLMIKGVP